MTGATSPAAPRDGLRLPAGGRFGRLHLITDTRPGRDPIPVVEAALAAGVRTIQVRPEDHLTDREAYQLTLRVLELCTRYDAVCLVNDRLHVAVALSATQVVFFVIYFLLGYLLYSSIAAALGAMTNSEQELQQLNMFLVMPLALCMFGLGFVVTNPDGLVPRVMSLIPFFTPLMMYMRIAIKMPAVWEIAFSIGATALTIWAILWVASRIYRVGVLMYGKKPNLPELMRWLKYS